MRSIPAPAGEPGPYDLGFGWIRVYPRACGGTPRTAYSACSRTGLSPRLRGNHRLGLPAPGLAGSIPAPAGEPLRRGQASPLAAVYPRACGGTLIVDGPYNPERGLSPRLRGNLIQLKLGIVEGGVYPRACGGTASSCGVFWWRQGLSPRLRGNQGIDGGCHLPRRSIPAPAGEPAVTTPEYWDCEVYPRACGGTCASQ